MVNRIFVIIFGKPGLIIPSPTMVPGRWLSHISCPFDYMGTEVTGLALGLTDQGGSAHGTPAQLSNGPVEPTW